MVTSREHALIAAVVAKTNGVHLSYHQARDILAELDALIPPRSPIAEEAQRAFAAISDIAYMSPNRLNDFANYVFSDGSTLEARIVQEVRFTIGRVERGAALADGEGKIGGEG